MRRRIAHYAGLIAHTGMSSVVSAGSVLRHRPFALLWSGQVISRIGDNIHTVALVAWVLHETGSQRAMGLVLLCTTLPMVALLLAGGVAGDRWPRIAVMYWSDVVRGLVGLSLGVLAGTGNLELWMVYVAGIAFGIAQAFFQPAYVAVVPQVTPKALLQQANSLTSLSIQLASIFGLVLGGGLIALGGADLGFFVNGLSFMASGATLLGLRWTRVRRGPDARQSPLADVREGLAAVWRSPWLWFTIMLAGVANVTLAGPMRVTVPFLLGEERNQGDWAYGLLLACGAAGAMAMAIAVLAGLRLRRRGVLAYCAWMMNGLMLLIFASSLPLGFLLLAALAGGACLTLFELVWVGTLQEMVPGDMLGRVASVDYVFSFGLLPLGLMAVGVLGEAIGPRDLLTICGLLTMLIPTLGLLHPAIRRLD